MKLLIEIDLDNAAFEHQPGTEVADLLERLAGRFWGLLRLAPDEVFPE